MNIESMAFVRQSPWTGLGTQVEANLSSQEMLEAAGLNWRVKKKKLVVQDTGRVLTSHYAIEREDNHSVLSVAGAAYKCVQNADSFDFFKKFVDAGHMSMEHCGSLHNGRFIWALAKIDADFVIGKEDVVKGYMLMMSPHEYGRSMVFRHLTMREWCWNTIASLLGTRNGRGYGSAFRMAHSTTFDETIKERAEIALGIAVEQTKEFAEVARKLSTTHVTEEQTKDFFYQVLRVSDAQVEKINSGEKKAPKNYDKFQHALTFAPGQELPTAKGTAWGLLNAVTYIADHQTGRTRDSGLTNAWFGEAAAMKLRAVEAAKTLALAA